MTGDKVQFRSNNPVEVGYEVTTDDVEVELTNPFPFDFEPVTSDSDSETDAAAKKKAFLLKVADFYNIYMLQGADYNYSYTELENFYDKFYVNKITELAGATDKEKLIQAYALDALMRH